MAGGKASFTNLDTKQVFTVQFNPKEFKLDSSAAWKDSDEFQQEKPLLTFDRGKPSTVALELIFDTTDGGDVGEKWVKPLRSFVSVNVEKTEGGKEIKRPPFIQFVWDKFKFDCVVESVSVQYLMFSAGGTPLRAKVSLALKESKLEVIQSSANGAITLSAMKSMMSGSGTAKTYVIKDGETLSQVAKKTNSDPKLIAAANNIKDPMQPPPGPVVIPSNAVAAMIFEHLNKSEALGNWGDFKPNLNPDSAASDDWSIEKGEFVFELTAEKEITFSSYQGEEVEANAYEQGESAVADNWDIGANSGVEHEYGEENETQFSEKHGGEVEKNEYNQGDSASSDGWDTAANSGIEHEYGEENEAQFSEKHGGEVEKNEYTQGDSASSDGWDTGKNEYKQGDSASSDGWDTSKNGPAEHKVGAENEAQFSEKHGGEVEKNEISHAEAKEEKMEGAAANTGKGGHSSNSDAGGAAGGKGGHSSDSSAGGAAGGKGEHSSDSSAGGAAGGKGEHSSDSSAAGAAGGKGGHSSDSSAGGAGSRGDAAAASAANNASDKGGAAAGADAAKPAGAQQAAADKAAASSGDKAADAAASNAADKAAADKSAPGGAAGAGVTASGGAKPAAGGSNAGAAAVSEKAGDNAKAAAAPPPETIKGDPTKDRSVTGRQVNPGDSATTNVSRDVSKVVAEAEKVAKDVNTITDEPKKMAAEGQFQADMIAAKAEMHADRITNKDTEATDKKK